MATQSEAGVGDELFAGGGEMAARMRSLDWSKTPLGPVETWPQSLKTSVSICLNSRFSILLWWGPELVKLYNDAYIELIGSKHPWALGSPGREVWPEIWETIGPMLTGVMERGEASWADDLMLFLERHGYAEECYFTFSYSPIRDESRGIGGVFTPVLETTEKVISARRLAMLRQLTAVSGRNSKSVKDACGRILRVLADNPHDVPFAAIYLFDDSAQASDAANTELRQGTLLGATAEDFPSTINFEEEFWSGCRNVAAGEVCAIDLTQGSPFPLPDAPWGIPPGEAIVVPIGKPNGVAPAGFLLAGVSARKRLNGEYREFYLRIAMEIADVIRDSEALERETALRAEAETQRTRISDILMYAPAPIALTSGPEHRYTLVNQAYVDLVGRTSPDDLIGKPVIEALPELRGQGIMELLDEVYRSAVPYIGNERLIRLNRPGNSDAESAETFFNFIYQAARDITGRSEGLFILAIEVTEQVLARREIETREEQFRVLANSIPQMAWMANADGIIVWYNRRWYEYTGATEEQMKGPGTEFVHPDFLPEVALRYNRSMATGEPFDMVFPLRRADGQFRSFLSRALPVRDKNGKIVRWFGTNTDVEAQQRAEAALRQSEKLAAVGRLASSIAHEINNPLEGVTNLIYLAQLTAENMETKRYLESAEEEMGRVSQIVNQTLRFHKQQSAVVPTDVAELLDSILTLYRGKLSRDGIELKLKVMPCPPLVCYAGEIRQVLANLIGNALDAMPRGGTLWLRLRPGTDWRSEKPGIRFTIADTGHGMTPETRRHIYEPFFTTKGETGTGLGLWVSKGIVEKHGGSMHVRSSAKSGSSWTLFSVTLPFAGGVPAFTAGEQGVSTMLARSDTDVKPASV